MASPARLRLRRVQPFALRMIVSSRTIDDRTHEQGAEPIRRFAHTRESLDLTLMKPAVQAPQARRRREREAAHACTEQATRQLLAAINTGDESNRRLRARLDDFGAGIDVVRAELRHAGFPMAALDAESGPGCG